MEILILSIWGLGIVLSFVGGLWLLILAFRQSVLWGLVVFFIPFASLVFIVKYWSEARQPFFVSLVSILLMMIGVFLGVMPSSPWGAPAPAGTEAAGFEPSSDPFGSGDPFGSREPSTVVEDPSPARPDREAPTAGMAGGETDGAEATRSEENLESLLAEIDGRATGAGDSQDGRDTVGSGDSAVEPAEIERADEPGADTGGSAREATSTTTNRSAPRRSSLPRARLSRGSDRRIPSDQLSRHVGKRLEVHTVDGDRLKGVLEAVDEDQIRLLVSLSGGSMTLRVPVERIEEIRRPR